MARPSTTYRAFRRNLAKEMGLPWTSQCYYKAHLIQKRKPRRLSFPERKSSSHGTAPQSAISKPVPDFTNT